MDEKFRTRWKGPGDLEILLEELISQKRYAGERDRVFVLEPVANMTRRSSSPLEWGAHCDYGHDEKRNHLRGAIWVAPHVDGGDAQNHLRRLIALQLQASFSQPIEADPSCAGRIMGEISKHAHVQKKKILRYKNNQDWGGDEFRENNEKIWIIPSFCIYCGNIHDHRYIFKKITGKNQVNIEVFSGNFIITILIFTKHIRIYIIEIVFYIKIIIL